MRSFHLFYSKDESKVLILNRPCWTRFYFSLINKLQKTLFDFTSYIDRASRMKLIMHYIDKIRNVYRNKQLSRNLVHETATHIKLKTRQFFFVNSINELILWVWADIHLSTLSASIIKKQKNYEVPPRFELGSLDSKSRVLTITPWDHMITILSLFAWISPLKSFSYV